MIKTIVSSKVKIYDIIIDYLKIKRQILLCVCLHECSCTWKNHPVETVWRNRMVLSGNTLIKAVCVDVRVQVCVV